MNIKPIVPNFPVGRRKLQKEGSYEYKSNDLEKVADDFHDAFICRRKLMNSHDNGRH